MQSPNKLPIEVAERLSGKRLDRRRNYYKALGTICYTETFTQACSGCCEIGEYGQGSENYPYDEKNKCLIGSGCHECGYTGKRRTTFFVPFDTPSNKELEEE